METTIRTQSCQEKLGVTNGGIKITGIVQHAGGFGECSQHETIPGSQDLIISPGPDPFFTLFQ